MSVAHRAEAANPASRRGRPAASLSYLDIYRAEPLQRIEIVKQGVPAAQAKQIISDLDISVAAASKALHVPVATLNRKAKNKEVLAQDESERFIGLARLIGQVQAMVEAAGGAEGFDAKAWTSWWLQEPLPAFGGVRPVDLMDTMEGQALVSDTLGRIQSGVYA